MSGTKEISFGNQVLIKSSFHCLLKSSNIASLFKVISCSQSALKFSTTNRDNSNLLINFFLLRSCIEIIFVEVQRTV